MANQHYGYTAGSYGGGNASSSSSLYSGRPIAAASLFADASFNGTSRYLSGDSLPPASSLLHHHEYSAGIPGIATPRHPYGPPGVNAGTTVVSTDSLYSGLKRRPIESLYHQTSLGIQNEIGLTEAWYSTNHLAKLPRYENTSHLPIYPQRIGEKDCDYYMQTRTCKFGDSCKFHHPIWVPEGGVPNWNEVPPTPSEYLPERPLQPDCPYFLKTQTCKFGNRCRFNHPKDKITQQGTDDGNASVLPERPSETPCAFYMKTGKCKFGSTCKFHHPKELYIQSGGNENGTHNLAGDAMPPVAPAWAHNSKGLPIRLGEEDCPFYVKTGSCKYGAGCRYNHPERYAAVTPTLAADPSTHFGISVPTASLPALDGRIAQAMQALGPTIYPQRPGQIACDYYMKTGSCKFVTNCKFDHPINRSTPISAVTDYQLGNVKLTLAGLPRREGATHCPFYMKTGTCKYGHVCKFDHPPPGEVMAITKLQLSSGAGEDA